MKWRYGLTLFIVMTMLFCLKTEAELYPFAPYTMYADKYLPKWSRELRIYLYDGALEEEVTEHTTAVYPFDEARLKHAFMQTFKDHGQVLDNPDLRIRAQEVLELAEKNTGKKFPMIIFRRVFHPTLEALRAQRPVIQDELQVKHD